MSSPAFVSQANTLFWTAPPSPWQWSHAKPMPGAASADEAASERRHVLMASAARFHGLVGVISRALLAMHRPGPRRRPGVSSSPSKAAHRSMIGMRAGGKGRYPAARSTIPGCEGPPAARALQGDLADGYDANPT